MAWLSAQLHKDSRIQVLGGHVDCVAFRYRSQDQHTAKANLHSCTGDAYEDPLGQRYRDGAPLFKKEQYRPAAGKKNAKAVFVPGWPNGPDNAAENAPTDLAPCIRQRQSCWRRVRS